jgi:archaellum component FlaF (FlaF/FlaG flagellin family)
MPDPIAVYGAVLGTAGAVGALWNIYDSMHRNRPHLKVVATLERREIAHFGDSSVTNELVTVKIINTGQRVVTVHEVGVVVDGPLRLSFEGQRSRFPAAVTTDQPLIIEEGSTTARELVGKAKAPYPYCTDVEGNTYKGHFSIRLRPPDPE